MSKCRYLIAALFIVLQCFFPPAPSVLANAGGYMVEPVTSGTDPGIPLETVEVTGLAFTPRDLATILALTISPVFLVPVELFFLLKLFSYLGYRKIASANALDHETRETLYACIRKNPGIHFHALSRKTAIKPGTMKYHLTVLRLTNKIVFFSTRGHTRYFENSGKYPLVEQNILRFLRNDTDRAIFEFLIGNPGISRKDLQKHLGVSGAAVSYHTSRLSSGGVLLVRKSGRDARYEIDLGARQYIEKYLSLLQETAGEPPCPPVS